MVRTEFGNPLSRFLRGGVRLNALEAAILTRLVDALPHRLKATVEAQFASYNLAQREADGRAVNFYRRGAALDVAVPLLKMTTEEAPLVRLTFVLPADGAPHHAVLTAVNGRAFSLSFDVDLRPLGGETDVTVDRVTEAWRSNFNP